ncbi:MAG: hypothetical protein IKS80_04700 [Bacteroidaceae bacterium]|nr:hypothetical protein [Bacteroidaceae bacterium]
MSSKAEVCPECGVRIAGNVKRCPVCQRTLLMYVTQCPHCQTRFEAPAEYQLEPGADSEGELKQEHVVVTPLPVVDDNDLDEATTDKPTADESAAQTPDESQPATPQKGGTPWYLLLFIIVIVGVGAYLYWDNHQQRRYSEEKAFELLQGCNDPLNFEDFIARYPNSEHLDEVREQLRALQKVDALWEVVAKSSNPEDFRNFIQAHPHSPYAKVALHKIDSLDWREADSKGSSEAYDQYILNHDAGEYITEAYAARDAARDREERARRDSIAAAQARADSLASEEVAVGIDDLMQ